jgi:DNA-binding NarL/FixJ family response regulator
MPYPIKIILVDDHELVRESIKTLLEKDSRFHVIYQCKNGVDAIEQAKNLQPDIIIMDINMTPVDGFEATKKIVQEFPAIKIIGISINNNPKYATKMLSLGAKGFITKTSAFAELKSAIQKVYDGENYICQEIKKKLPAQE